MYRRLEIYSYVPIIQKNTPKKHLYRAEKNCTPEEVFDIIINELKELGYEVVYEESNKISIEGMKWDKILELAKYMIINHFDLTNNNRIDIRILFFKEQGGNTFTFGVCMASLKTKWLPKELDLPVIILISDPISGPKSRKKLNKIRKVLEFEIDYFTYYALEKPDDICWHSNAIDAYKSGFLGLVIVILLIQMLKSQIIQHIFKQSIRGKVIKDRYIIIFWVINSFFDYILKGILEKLDNTTKVVNETNKDREFLYNKIVCVKEFLLKQLRDQTRENSIMHLTISITQLKINRRILWLTIVVMIFGVLSLLFELVP